MRFEPGEEPAGEGEAPSGQPQRARVDLEGGELVEASPSAEPRTRGCPAPRRPGGASTTKRASRWRCVGLAGGAELVDVEVDGRDHHPEAVDAGLLGGLPQRDAGQVGVAVDVAAGLEPALHLARGTARSTRSAAASTTRADPVRWPSAHERHRASGCAVDEGQHLGARRGLLRRRAGRRRAELGHGRRPGPVPRRAAAAGSVRRSHGPRVRSSGALARDVGIVGHEPAPRARRPPRVMPMRGLRPGRSRRRRCRRRGWSPPPGPGGGRGRRRRSERSMPSAWHSLAGPLHRSRSRRAAGRAGAHGLEPRQRRRGPQQHGRRPRRPAPHTALAHQCMP